MTTQARILIMDDDPEIREVLGLGLAHCGYQVETAATVNEAVDYCIKEKPDLAILDVLMPDTSGIEAARRIRAEAQVPFVFLSAADDQEIVQQAIAEGALGYLLKPIDVFRIAPSIEAALQRAQDIRRLQEKARLADEYAELPAHDPRTSVAVGLLMERFKTPEETALQMLKTHAQGLNKPLETIAHDIIEAARYLNLAKVSKPGEPA